MRSWFSSPPFDSFGWKSPMQRAHISLSSSSRSPLYFISHCIPMPDPLPWFVPPLHTTNSLTPLAAGKYNVPAFLSCLAEPSDTTPSTSATVCLQPFHPHLFQFRTRNGPSTPRVTLLQAARHRRFCTRPDSPILLRSGLRIVPTMEHPRVGLGGKRDR